MNKKMFFLRRGISSDFIKKIGDTYNLELAYQDKNETILKNNCLMIVIKKKYISVIIYDGRNYILTSGIIKQLSN